MTYRVDPDLSKRRLRTLVRLLETEARTIAKRSWKEQRATSGELDANEMREWAAQCTNLLRGQ